VKNNSKYEDVNDNDKFQSKKVFEKISHKSSSKSKFKKNSRPNKKDLKSVCYQNKRLDLNPKGAINMDTNKSNYNNAKKSSIELERFDSLPD